MSTTSAPGLNPTSGEDVAVLGRKRLLAASLAALFFALLLALALEAQLGIRAGVSMLGRWSKSSSAAGYELGRYAATGDESHYLAFQRALAFPLAENQVRIAFEQQPPDTERVRKAMLAAGIAPSEAERMILFRRFRDAAARAHVQQVWRAANTDISRLARLGASLHREILGGRPDRGRVLELLAEGDGISRRLAAVEADISGGLSDAGEELTRWMVALLVLTAACVATAMLLALTHLRTRLGATTREVERYADIVKHMQIGLHVWQLEDPNNPTSLRLVTSNPAAAALVRRAGSDGMGATILEILPGLKATGVPRLFSDLIQRGDSRDLGAVHYSDPRMGRVTFGVKVFALPDNCIGVTFEDITERDRAESELRESRSFLERSQEVAHIGSWISELGEGALLTWSPEVFRIFGVDPDLFGGRADDFFARVHPDDLAAVREAAARAIAQRERYSVMHRVVRPDGSLRWVHQQADVEQDAENRPVRLIGVVQDITERHELEEQLLQSQRLEGLGRLAGGVAHDFNNLLTAILGYAELLRSALDPADSHRAAVDEILTAGQRAAALTRQLLAFSRRQVLVPQVLDLNGLVEAMRVLLERLIGEDVALETRLSTSPCRVRADTSQLEQVIMNLAVNARDAMPQGGRLVLATSVVDLEPTLVSRHQRTAGRYVCLSVSDTGIGMAPAVRMRIFEPFFSTKDRAKGTGLGLATVYGIVQQSGGLIEVESAPGCGARFDLYLPSVEAPVDGIAIESRAGTAPAVDETVLLVEDEKLVRDLVRDILLHAGYRVLEAEGGLSALALSGGHEGPIHLLVSDVIMPGMSGPDLARRFTVLRPEAAILFISGYTDDALARHGVPPGANFLQKPFRPGALLDKVRASLASAFSAEQGERKEAAPDRGGDPGQ